MDCFTESGEMIAHDGKGQFDGIVSTGTPSNPLELRMHGRVKDGLPDGEWQLTGKSSSEPFSVEQFSSGKFLRGVSSSFSGRQEYDKGSLSSVESIHPIEGLDYYSHNDFCTVAGKDQAWDPGEQTLKKFTEIGSRIKDIVKSDRYRDYSGWILLDIHYDKAGRVSAKSVRLYQENEALRKELLTMVDRLQKPGKMTLDGNGTPYERWYVVLVEATQVVIPEEVLYKRRQAFLFGSK